MPYNICIVRTAVVLLFLVVQTVHVLTSNIENNVTDGLNSLAQMSENNGGNFTEYGMNFTSLIYEYVLVCGFEKLCYPQRLSFYTKVRILFCRRLECPPCSCKNDCLKHDNCCPDKANELFLLECVDVRIMTSSNMSETYNGKYLYMFKMINKCYLQNGEQLTRNFSNKNETLIDSLINPPVVSNEGISYRNKRYAECNGITNFTFWEFDIDCEIFTDFNYISSYEELIDEAEKRACDIRYKPISFDNYHYCATSTDTAQSVVKSCNVSGGWKVYNQDVESACLSQYNVAYQHYKNVFCFLCNPKVHENEFALSKCNYTGVMKSYDPELEKACESFTSSEALWPFKNIFCLSCNNRMARNVSLLDAVINIEEGFSYSDSSKAPGIHYRIDVTRLKYAFYIKTITKYRSDYQNSNISSQNSVVQFGSRNKITNIAKLIEHGFATDNTYRYCYDPSTSRLLPFSKPDSNMCSCRYTCLFSNVECCVNLALQVTTTCFKQTISSADLLENSSNKYLAVQSCKDTFEGSPSQSRCKQSSADDIFAFLPVYFDGVLYRNFDCLVCNEFYAPRYVQLRDFYRAELPWNIDLFCTDVLEYAVLDTIMDIIHLAKRKNCSLQYIPPRSNQPFSKEITPKKCGNDSDLISRCNATGMWINYDHDIAMACERVEQRILPVYKTFKNVYCFLCNPSFSGNATVSGCNETGKWDIHNPNIEKACKTFPTISALYPYKNIFCKLCNQKTLVTSIPPFDDYYSLGSLIGRSGKSRDVIFGNYRNLFGLPLQYETSIKDKTSQTGKCGNEEIYDSIQNECRQLKCYPGRFLQNRTCVALFNSASNMRYTLTYSIEGELMSSNHTMLNILHNVSRQIKKSIRSTLGAKDIYFSSFYLVSNKTCDYDVTVKRIEKLRLHMFTSFHIHESIKRQEAEKSLLGLKEKAINFDIDRKNVSFRMFKDDVAYRIPSLINRLDFQQKCFVMQTGDESKSHFTYRTSFVSMLLTCDQVELEPDVFYLDSFQASLTLKPSGAIFSYDEFYLLGDGRARVCTDLFIKKTSVDGEDVDVFDTIINLVSLICTCISMVCLFVTFITYCLLPSLRSLPGKNNMGLVAAMFFAQGFFQFGLKQTGYFNVCIIIGILIHYFWLVMFFCLNICTFHMYRVFCHDVVTFTNKNQNKIFRRYILFCYGTPFLIVLTKVGIFYLFTRSFGYGGSTCFISEITSYVLSFLLPVIVICIFNIILFGFAIYKIKTSPNVQSNVSSKKDTWIYLKLFSITGISWILMIIDSFFSVSFFSVIVGILNGLQGLFIMSSYIINNRVKLQYKKMFKTTYCCIVSGSDKSSTESRMESTKVSSPKLKTSEESTTV